MQKCCGHHKLLSLYTASCAPSCTAVTPTGPAQETNAAAGSVLSSDPSPPASALRLFPPSLGMTGSPQVPPVPSTLRSLPALSHGDRHHRAGEEAQQRMRLQFPSHQGPWLPHEKAFPGLAHQLSGGVPVILVEETWTQQTDQLIMHVPSRHPPPGAQRHRGKVTPTAPCGLIAN